MSGTQVPSPGAQWHDNTGRPTEVFFRWASAISRAISGAGPTTSDDFANVIASLTQSNLGENENAARLDDLERRIETPNLSDIYARIDTLERLVANIQSPIDLTQQIDDLRKVIAQGGT